MCENGGYKLRAMKLTEAESKKLFSKYGIAVPRGVEVHTPGEFTDDFDDVYIKAQVHFGDRKKLGGIVHAQGNAEIAHAVGSLLGKRIKGEVVHSVLVEEAVAALAEYYVSISFDSAARGPVLSVNAHGGSGIADAHVAAFSVLTGPTPEFIAQMLKTAGFPDKDIAPVSAIVVPLWQLVVGEYALLAEINPLFKTDTGFVAGDAKIILDDGKHNPSERRYVEMDGDIAMLLSGGGASMLLMDVLLEAGGKPANYTEYSGNPPAEVVKELTLKVLSRPGLRGCLVAGGAANFTDIHETLSGFLAGLRELPHKPTYPIVIRRDGPRRVEAFEMLRTAAAQEGYDFHLYSETTPMIEAARTVAKLSAAYTPINA